ncbi:SURF1 family [Musa troglodytarum]|uniref:SURF1-like protein n=1 Tax=Musa troglodytarum TaxID=320322 RepID=A0A9E7KPA6_9LILI|nr:SURF1 family [Musa troglodytarum]
MNVQVEENSTAPTRVIGVVRGSEKPSIFVPENDPSTGQWFYVDVPMIARACGVPDNTLYIEDINEDVSASNPYPIPKDVNTLIRHSVMPQDHLNYTFTWYSSRLL